MLNENYKEKLAQFNEKSIEFAIDNVDDFNKLFEKLYLGNECKDEDYIKALRYLFQMDNFDIDRINFIADLIISRKVFNGCDKNMLNIFINSINLLSWDDECFEKSVKMREYVCNCLGDDCRELGRDDYREHVYKPLYKGYARLGNYQKAAKYALESAEKEKTESAYDAYQAYRYCEKCDDIELYEKAISAMTVASNVPFYMIDYYDDNFGGILLSNIMLSHYFMNSQNYWRARSCYENIINLCEQYPNIPAKSDDDKRYEKDIDRIKESAQKRKARLDASLGQVEEVKPVDFEALFKQQSCECDDDKVDVNSIADNIEQDVESIESQLVREGIWGRLLEDSKTYLQTADMVRAFLKKESGKPFKKLSYSPAMIPLFKALESELYTYCVAEFYKWAKNNNCSDDEFTTVWEYINRRKHFTIGCVATEIISECHEDEDEIDEDELCIRYVYEIKPLFKKYVERRFNIEEKDIDDKLTKICIRLNGKNECSLSLVKRRNNCAHKCQQSEEQCDGSFFNVLEFFKLWKEIFH